MKLFTGHLIGFGIMFAVCYVAAVVLMLFVPLIGAFIMWDLTPLSFGWEHTMFWARLIAIFSALMGFLFTTSSGGNAFAHNYAEGKL